MTDTLTLYDAPNSPCARRVRMCLLEKGIDFEIHWMNLALMDQKQAWYLKLNPNGLVPTLKHGDRVVYESNVINEYLEAIHPEPALMPSDPYEQAQVRMWIAFEQEWAKPFRDAIYETFAKDRLKSNVDDPATLEAEIAKRTSNPFYTRFARKVLTTPKDEALLQDKYDLLHEKMAWWEDKLSDGREWLVGGRFSFADIAMAPRTDMFELIGVTDFATRYPRITDFMGRVKARPSWTASQILPEGGAPTTKVAA